MKVLLKRFHLNGHTIGFHRQTQKFELHTKVYAIRFTEIVHDRSCKSVKQITENGLERSFVKYLLNSV